MDRCSVLFLCKKSESYGFRVYSRRSSGLYNSTRFVAEAIPNAKVVEVTDNNDIDREVTKYKPRIVVIEALWVVPEKFDVLKKLHPEVQWYVHLHSNIPFLASEGVAMEWIMGYQDHGVGVIVNSEEAYDAISRLIGMDDTIYLPNVYTGNFKKPLFENKSCIDVACFGAVRPMKNHLAQALAAISFARKHNKMLRFHINSTRVEGSGDPVLKNLRALFDRISGAELIEHGWYDHEEFLGVLEAMDVGMQVSLSETFNIVTADMVCSGLPVVGSREIKWLIDSCKANPASVEDMVTKLESTWKSSLKVERNQSNLKKHSKMAVKSWLEFAKGGR